MFLPLGRLIGRTPWLFLGLVLLVVGFSGWYGRDTVQYLTLAPGWEVPGSGSTLAAEQLREQLGRNETTVIALFGAGPDATGTVDDRVFRDEVEAVLARAATNPEVRGVDSYYSTANPRMRTTTGDMTYALIRLSVGDDEGVGAYRRLRTQLHSDRLRVELGGELATYVEAREQLARDVRRAEVASFLLLALMLVWVFGSLVAAALPLAIGGVTVLGSSALLKFCAHFFDISVYAANVVSVLGLGLAVDYGLFIVSRFREEMARADSNSDPVLATLATAGRTVAFSGLTVASSMLCMLLLPQRFFQNMGLAGAIAVGTAMLTTVVLLPTLLSLLGTRIDRLTVPLLARRIARQQNSLHWYKFSYRIMRHPLPVLVASLLLLGTIGLPVLHLDIRPSDSRSLPADAESRRVEETLERRFPSAELNPLVVTLRTRGKAHDGDGIEAIHRLSGEIRALPGVTRVTGLASLEPTLSLADYRMLYQHPDEFPLARAALDGYAKGNHSLIVVHYAPHPSSPEARRLVRSIRELPMPKGIEEVHVGGFPAAHLDYVDSLLDGVPRVIAAICCVVVVLLFVMLGSVLVPIKAVLTNLLSLSATFGGLVWIFQEGHLADLLNFTPQGGLEGSVLVLIFACAFGLAIDYEVFLLSRIKEVCLATGNNIHAVASGLQKSGPIITNAALLIGIVLGTFAMGEVVFMKATGLGLLLSVLVDATLVRMLLVPSTLRLLGRLSWWAPKPLQRLHARLNRGAGHGH